MTDAPAPRGRLVRWLSRLNLRAKLMLMSTSISIVCFLVATSVLVTGEFWAMRDALLARAQALAETVAANSEAALGFNDREGAEILLATVLSEPLVTEARVVIPEPGTQQIASVPFARVARDDAAMRPITVSRSEGHRFDGSMLQVIRPVRVDGEEQGWVFIRLQLTLLEELLGRIGLVLLPLLVATVILAWLLSSRLERLITRPAIELLRTAETVRQFKNYSVRARKLGHDELGQVTTAFNAMLDEVESHDAARTRIEAEIRDLNEQLEAKVRARTEDLQQSNLGLSQALERLHTTQDQLVESEKMAALGGLVAGVAHEINTPLGICVTMASHLDQQVAGLRSAYERGIKRTDLERFLEDSEQSARLIQSNLDRATGLVRSFKQVAVDQSTEGRRRFHLAGYLTEVLTSLGPQLKRSKIRASIHGERTIEIDSYPGVFAQIITTLTMNAVVHAFGDDGGEITIDLERRGPMLEMVFADNGRGMSDEVRQRVFDPFFTTRRGQGGSGLGLHITYNQVTRQLGGSIRCESGPGEGTRFVLLVPLVSPGSPGAEAA